MNHSSKQKLAAAATVAVLIAGGAVAAVTAVGQDSSKRATSRRATHERATLARRTGHLLRARDLMTAASYLGSSPAQLQSELQSGLSLAQVANATSGKSAAGLIEALVAEKKTRLATLSHDLTKRVTAEVNRSGGPGLDRGARARRMGRGMFSGPRHLGLLAASYLGTSPEQLRSDLQAGLSLADVANATSGKSAAGLIDALVAARRASLAAAVASGKLSQRKANALGARLTRRVAVVVNRRFPKR